MPPWATPLWVAALSRCAAAAAPDDDRRWLLSPNSASEPFANHSSFWFGANSSGPDGPHLGQNNVTRYAAAWFGWQSLNSVGGCVHEEAKLHLQTSAVKAARPAQLTLAYGVDVSSVMTLFDKQGAALADKENSGWYLPSKSAVANRRRRQVTVTATGAAGDGCSPTGPAYDFRNASARDFFAKVVIGQWASDDTVDSVFVDEADAVVCCAHTIYAHPVSL